nr:MAG: hypothetical protein [Microvirus sp.]
MINNSVLTLTHHPGANNMKHCLNKRNRYETFNHDPEDFPQKLQKGNQSKPQEPQNSPDERRRKVIENANKRGIRVTAKY